ncbi:BioY protein [Fictibacillus macauensis ZFHKF-1]|uniref:Biotin transporter n=1 Tax=Fictibacillus macauensis ZFHKF-1 TaxID=1196324 RepID=I8UFN7_9BACL|nr:biotin transporter BioY [Fictibacillus macauensis]EIT85628.1 BioY protein [Fictibacillus macauensis ZFHKF-1]
MKFKPIDLTLAAMFAALMAIGANITAWIPALAFGSVPLTLQNFFCVLAGLLLGRRLGAVSMIVYLLVGLIGAPIFAGFTGGFATIMKPSFGFILSYIAGAYAAGLIVDRSKKPTFPTFLVAAFVSLAVSYVIGTTLLYVALTNWAAVPGITYLNTWKGMLVFIPKDLVLTFVTAVIAPRIYYAISKNRTSHTQRYA